MKAVFFDIDGTLLDTLHYIWAAFNHTAKQYGLTDITLEDVANLHGASLAEAYTRFAPNHDFADLSKTHSDFQHAHPHLTKPFPHTITVLSQLKEAGLKIVAITSRGTSVQSTLEENKIVDYFDLVLTSKDVENVKPHPEGIQKALLHLKLQPGQACMVGDTTADIGAGKNAGVVTIGAAYGFSSHQDLAALKPDYIVDDLLDIIPIILPDHHEK
jgi:pyrophosphatase PpaX